MNRIQQCGILPSYPPPYPGTAGHCSLAADGHNHSCHLWCILCTPLHRPTAQWPLWLVPRSCCRHILRSGSRHPLVGWFRAQPVASCSSFSSFVLPSYLPDISLAICEWYRCLCTRPRNWCKISQLLTNCAYFPPKKKIESKRGSSPLTFSLLM